MIATVAADPTIPARSTRAVSSGFMPRNAFTAEQLIDEGAMGQVWRGRHVRTGMPVAMKMVRPERIGAALAADAVRREARTVAGLAHPHVIWVFDQGLVDDELALVTGVPVGTPYLVMEHLSGGNLLDRQHDRWEAVRADLVAILEALAHVHARGVIHRDLKPGNVLFGAEGDIRTGLKLADFGVAQTPDRIDGLFGTPQYCAPEQHDDSAPQGPWTDLYAVGVLAWLLTTGAAPFARWRGVGVFLAKTDRMLPELDTRFPCPDGLEGWLHDCLAPTVGARFQTAPDALHALLRLDTRLVGGTRAPRAPCEEDAPTALLTGGTVAPAQHPAPAAAPLPADAAFDDDPLPQAALRDAGLGLWRDRPTPLFTQGPQRTELLAAFDAAVREGRAKLAVVSGPRGSGRSSTARWIQETVAQRSGAATWFIAEGTLPACKVLASTIGTPATALPWLALRGLDGPGVREVVQCWVDGGDPVPAAAAVVRAVARGRPAVLVIDDAQVDEPLVAELLAGPPVPLLMVVVGETSAPAIRIRPLTLMAAEPLAQLLGEVLPLAPDTLAAVASEASGRPGRALRLLHDAWDAGRWSLTPRGLTMQLEAPARPLPDLAPGLRAILERVAVGGIRPPVDAACIAWDPPDAARRALDDAEEAGLVRLDDDAVEFAPGVRQALLAGIQDLSGHHLAWAERLPISLERARHLMEAGALDQGMEEMAMVLDDPGTRVGLAVVVAHAERALERWQLAGRRPNDGPWATVVLGKAVGRLSLGDGVSVLQDDLARARQAGLPALEARLRLLEAEHLGADRATLRDIHGLVAKGPFDTRAIVERALRMAAGREGDGSDWEHWLERCRASTRTSTDPRIRDLRVELEAESAAYDRDWDAAYGFIRRCEDLHPGYTDTRWALFALAAGALDEAAEHAEAGVRRSAARGDRGHLPWALHADALVHALRGRAPEARRRLEAAHRLTVEHTGRWNVDHRFLLGWLALAVAEGDLPRADRALARLPAPAHPSPEQHAVLSWFEAQVRGTPLTERVAAARERIPHRSGR